MAKPSGRLCILPGPLEIPSGKARLGQCGLLKRMERWKELGIGASAQKLVGVDELEDVGQSLLIVACKILGHSSVTACAYGEPENDEHASACVDTESLDRHIQFLAKCTVPTFKLYLPDTVEIMISGTSC